MKRYIIFFSIFIATSAFLSGCKDELSDINKNPNEATVPQPAYLLTSTIKVASDQYWGITNNMGSSLLFVQHWAMVQYTDPDRYVFTPNSFTSGWSNWYATCIAQLKTINSLGEASGNSNYQGVSLVLRSWIYSLLTETYGDIPYSQANSINEYLTPVYDSQEDVYKGLLNDLKQAQTLLKVDGPAISGDIIYSGSIIKWKKFANSLRLRLALRIADRLPATTQAVINEIQQEGSGYISSNAENAKLDYQDAPYQNPVYLSFFTRQDYRISKTIVDKLFELNDPRLPVYAAPTTIPSTQLYVGLPNGLTTSEASNIGFDNVSLPGAYFTAVKAPAVIISYAEVLFFLAEASSRGYVQDDAATLYQNAIRASLAQYGIGTNATEQYLSQASVTFNPANYKKSIGEQKWIALFGQGIEAFSEWRRLDYPQLTPAKTGVLGGKMPVRFLYPGTEQSLNGVNYKAAVSHQGVDALTTKLWFDVN